MKTIPPPTRPARLAKTVSSGMTRTPARTRGMARKGSGSSPIVSRASISSFTFIVPISAAKAEPDRPARMMAVKNGALSRNIDRITASAT